MKKRAGGCTLIALAFAFISAPLGEASAHSHWVDLVRLDLPTRGELPSEEEFLVAAKRTFYRRDMEYRVLSPTVVQGNHEGRYLYEIRRVEGALEIEWTGAHKPSSKRAQKYLFLLERDLRYELGKYLL